MRVDIWEGEGLYGMLGEEEERRRESGRERERKTSDKGRELGGAGAS